MLRASPPPPAHWRTKEPSRWGSRNWADAWRDAQAEAAEKTRLYQGVRKWTRVLLGEPNTSIWWHDNRLPKAQARENGKTERLACPGRQNVPTRQGMDHPQCIMHWPAACTAYAFGIGDRSGYPWEAAWGLPINAVQHGCRVHAYDPTVKLRTRHANRAQKVWPDGNVTFHYAGLGNGVRANSTKNSYGKIDGTTLTTFAELVHANPVDERIPGVLQIDCEGCEWGAVEQMSNDPEAIQLLRNTAVLLLDVHLSPSMMPPTLWQFVNLFDFLFETLGMRLGWMRSVDGYPGDQSVADFLGVAGLPASLCCYELALLSGRTQLGEMT